MPEPKGIVVREGYPFIASTGSVFILFLLFGLWIIALFFLLFTFFVAWFFRNPKREVPSIDAAAVSPADGRIVEVCKVQDPQSLSAEAVKISIFMSLFNVHVNRSPVKGIVRDIRYQKGSFLPANRSGVSEKNEQNAMVLATDFQSKMTCVQVAGLLARRIVCWSQTGQRLNKGERFGLIRFGSRVDCFFPNPFEVDARVGQRVRAGETIMGYVR